MPIKEITKKMFECTCIHPECSRYTTPWYTEKVPNRCSGCKRRNWNRPPRIRSMGHKLTFNGITKTIGEWASELGLAKPTIPWRLNQGWPIEQVLSKEDWRIQR